MAHLAMAITTWPTDRRAIGNRITWKCSVPQPGVADRARHWHCNGGGGVRTYLRQVSGQGVITRVGVDSVPPLAQIREGVVHLEAAQGMHL